MRKTLTMALVILAVSLPARAEKWAVVVGINHYQSDTISPLRYAEADAREFARALEKAGGFPTKNIFVFTADQKGSQAPTRTNLAFRFDYLIRTMGPDDTLVVYFAGHGIEMDGQSFLLTAEADARSLLTLQQSALHARDLYGWIARSKANQVLLLVDACRNDPVAGRGNGQNPMSDNLARDLTIVRSSDSPAPRSQPASYATLFACSAGQRSYEWSDKGHGFFTYYLVEGLEGKAANPDGRVTLQSLANYVQAEVNDASNRWALQQQMPWLRYEGPGADRFELARVASTQPMAAVQPRPEPKPVTVATPQPRPEPKPVATPQPRPEPVTVATPQPRPEPKPVATPQPRPEPVAAATPQPQPRPEPGANPQPRPEPAVVADPSSPETTEPSGPKPPAISTRAEVPVGTPETISMNTPVQPTSKTLRVSQSGDGDYRSLREAVRRAPYGAVITVSPGIYKEDVEILRGCTIEGVGEVVIVGTVSTIAPATLRNIIVIGEILHPERFRLEKVQLMSDDRDRLGPPGFRLSVGGRR